MEYRLLESTRCEEFVQLVNESLSDNWKLHGQTFAMGRWYLQAMTRKTDIESQQQQQQQQN